MFYIFSLEAVILLGIFEKMPNKITASKKLLKATACLEPESIFTNYLVIGTLILF